MVKEVVLYYQCLFLKFSPNKDLYTYMFFIRTDFAQLALRRFIASDLRLVCAEFLSFMYLVVFQQDFTGVETSSLLDIFMQSRIPSKYVWLLVGQFLLIIVERIIYLLKSTKAKLALHYILVFLYHWGLCFQLPSTNGIGFSASPGLLIFYLIQCLYLYLSCLQLRYESFLIHYDIRLSSTSHQVRIPCVCSQSLPHQLEGALQDSLLDLYECPLLEALDR